MPYETVHLTGRVGKLAAAAGALVLLAGVALLLFLGSDSKKPAAEAALREAEQAVNAAAPEARKYVPAMVQENLDVLAEAKKQLQRGDYKAALASAVQLKSRADEMVRATAEWKANPPK